MSRHSSYLDVGFRVLKLVLSFASLCGTLRTMNIIKMLADLRAEREQVIEAIIVLERLSVGRGKRRGRPPKWMTEVKKRGRPKGSKNKLKEID